MVKFSDIFIAKLPAEAIHYDVTAPNYPHIAVVDLTDHELSTLWASLSNSPLKSKHALEFIEIESDALLYRLPDAFTEALAKLDKQQIVAAASIWCESEDFPWRKTQATEKIVEIHDIAQRARKENKSLFLIFT